MPFTTGFAARANLAGQTANVRFDVSTGWGTTPATLTLVAPIDSFGAVQGQVTDLTVQFEGVQLTFRDVLVKNISTSQPADAYLAQVTILDRRWRWGISPIDGDYNVPLPTGTGYKREKTPQELATLLFQAMGEVNFDVANLPNDARPRMAWRAAEAAQELDRLCASLGCAVVFNGATTDRASIHRIGVGAATYGGPHESRTDGLTLPIVPDRLVVKCGTVLFQSAIVFGEAVGMDTDGKIKPIDQLSYKPTAVIPRPGGGPLLTGWEAISDPVNFDDIEATYIREGVTVYARDLAKATVFRWYRATGLKRLGQQGTDGWAPLALKNTPQAGTSIDDLGPIEDTRLERDVATGHRLPASIFGIAADERESGLNSSAQKFLRKLQFRVNNETKCIEFSEPVYKYGFQDSEPPIQPAFIVLIAAHACSKNGVPIRHEKFVNTGQQFDGGDRIEHHDEIVREIIEYRVSDGPGSDNVAKVDAEANHYLQALLAEYQAPQDSAQITLPLIYANFECDGRLREISWTGGSTDAARTRLAYNSAISPYTPDFRDTPEQRARREAEAAERSRAALLDARLRPPDPLGM